MGADTADDETPGAITFQELFAMRMREYRRRRDWSAQKLAERIAEMAPASRLSRGTLAKIESGNRAVWFEEAMLIAAALAVPPDLLMMPRPDDPWSVTVGEHKLDSDTAVRWNDGLEPLPWWRPGDRRFYGRVASEARTVDAEAVLEYTIAQLEERGLDDEVVALREQLVSMRSTLDIDAVRALQEEADEHLLVEAEARGIDPDDVE